MAETVEKLPETLEKSEETLIEKTEETLGGGVVEKMEAEVEIKPAANIKLSPFTVFKAAEVRPPITPSMEPSVRVALK